MVRIREFVYHSEKTHVLSASESRWRNRCRSAPLTAERKLSARELPAMTFSRSLMYSSHRVGSVANA